MPAPWTVHSIVQQSFVVPLGNFTYKQATMLSNTHSSQQYALNSGQGTCKDGLAGDTHIMRVDTLHCDHTGIETGTFQSIVPNAVFHYLMTALPDSV